MGYIELELFKKSTNTALLKKRTYVPFVGMICTTKNISLWPELLTFSKVQFLSCENFTYYPRKNKQIHTSS